MKDKKDTFLFSRRIVIESIITLAVMIAIVVASRFINLEGKTDAEGKPTDLYIIALIVWGVMLIPLIIQLIKCGTKIELSERGIRRSLFKVFMVREIGWNELYEISIKFDSGAWVFFSKSDLKKTPYSKAMRRKDQIQVAYSEKLRQAVKKYTDKEIPKLF